MVLRSSAFMALARYHVISQQYVEKYLHVIYFILVMVGFCSKITAITPSNSFLNIYILIYKLKAMINLASLTVRSIF